MITGVKSEALEAAGHPISTARPFAGKKINKEYILFHQKLPGNKQVCIYALIFVKYI